MSTVDACPPKPEETAELYLLGMLSTAEAAAFERHIFVCHNCLNALQEMNDHVWLMQKGLRLLEERLKQ